MKAKTYKATSIQQALDQIKSELGSDAMILSTQKLAARHAFGLIRRNVWEVTAAVNDFKTLPASNAASHNPLLRFSEPAQDPEPAKRPHIQRNVKRNIKHEEPGVTPRDLPAPIAARLQNSDSRFERLLEEVNGLKKTLQFITQTIPVPARDMNGVFGELVTAGFAPEAADELIASVSQGQPPEGELRQRLRQALTGKFLVETAVEFLARARTISVFVGPTGMGKTTAVAKIAGHAKARFRKRVTVISMDTFRVGGQDQLAAYANLMDIPAYACADVPSLKRLIRSLGDDLILIDTPGLSPGDDTRLAAVKAIAEIPDARVHAVFSAATQAADIDKFMNEFDAEPSQRVLISKVDEVETVNPLLAHAVMREIPISFISDGPNVPEDLSVHTANDFAAAILPAEVTEEVEAE